MPAASGLTGLMNEEKEAARNASELTEGDLRDRIHAEQVRSAYGSTAPGISVSVISSTLIATILAGTGAIGWTLAAAFAGFVLLQVSARLMLIHAFRRRQPPDRDWRRWSRYFSTGTFVAGVGHGGFSMLLMPPDRFDLQLLVMVYLCAVTSGAITAFGVLPAALYSLIVPMLVLPAVWMMMQGDWVHWIFALLMLGWLWAISEQARRFGAQFAESVRLRFENEQLIVRLRQEKQLAEEASLAKSRFLAAASHDLRQPVHALSLFVAALRPRISDAEALRMLDHIDNSVQAMGGLFNGLLDISRLDAGVVEVNEETFAVQPLLERICRDFAHQAQAKRIALRLRPSSAAVRSDPLLLERVVRNIVANAVAYTAQGRVLVGCRRRGRSIVVQVWDTGRGIPRAEQSKIFQEFYQVGNPERDRTQGVGLGLAIVRRLTELLRHPLAFRSWPDKGSMFEVAIPASDVAAPPVVERTGEPRDAGGTAAALVVVVDDEVPIQIAMRDLLEEWGFEVVAGGSFDDVIGQLVDRPRRPGLIICDYRLRAYENGIRVIERLRAEYNDDDIPGMLITGDTAPDRLREARESGLLLLHKPVANARLRAVITRLVAPSASRSAAAR